MKIYFVNVCVYVCVCVCVEVMFVNSNSVVEEYIDTVRYTSV